MSSFSAEAPGAVVGDSDVYVSEVLTDGSVQAPALAAGLNTAAEPEHEPRSVKREV
jgi:hypothetical protein